MVVPDRCTDFRFLRACSVALRIASGTARLLPTPSPTRPRLSPTTIVVRKAKRRPPLITFATRAMSTTRSSSSSPLSSFRSRLRTLRRSAILELQSACPRAVGQSLHAPVLLVPAPVEDHPGHALGLGPRCHRRPDQLGLLGLLLACQAGLEFRIHGRRGAQRRAVHVVNHLRVDVRQAAIDVQAWPLGGPAHMRPHPPVAAFALLCSLFSRHRLSNFPGLTSLAADVLAQVTQAFALVRLRRAPLADI